MASSEERLRRYLYLATEKPHYVCGNPELSSAPDTFLAVQELLKSPNISCINRILEEVDEKNAVFTRETLFCVLAVAVTSAPAPSIKHKLFCTLTKILRTTEDLCCFIKFYTLQKKKFSTALNKVIANYYLKKDPYDLAVEVTNNNSYHSWSVKDIFKLSHIKSTDICISIVLRYVMFGIKQASKSAEGKPEAELIMERLSKVNELKRCESEEKTIELVRQLQCKSQQLPVGHRKSLAVWEVLLPYVPLNELLLHLQRFFKNGFFKGNSAFQKQVIALLTNDDIVQASKIHPVEVFIALRNFEKGGKPICPITLQSAKGEKSKLEREPPKCPNIVSALNKMMQISFKNNAPTQKSMLFTFDTYKMDRDCLESKNINCYEATAILILSYLKVENEVTVAAFNDTTINLVNMEKNITFNQALNRLKKAKSCRSSLPAPFQWAIKKKKQINVFVHCLNRLPAITSSDKNKIIEDFCEYKTKMNQPNSKLILLSLNFRSAADYVEPNVLMISGISKEVPKIMNAFINDLFA